MSRQRWQIPKRGVKKIYFESESSSVAADPVVQYMNADQLNKLILQTQKKMEKAAKELDFIQAAQFRDELAELKQMVEQKRR